MNTKEYIRKKKKCKQPESNHPKENLQELHQLLGSILHMESTVNRGAMDLSVHQRERIHPPCEIVSHLP
jgi:hypothetical protein